MGGWMMGGWLQEGWVIDGVMDVKYDESIQISNIIPAYQYKHQYYYFIYIMDHKIQSRINRSLMIHDLDNLVFQKRQRKNVQLIPRPIQNSNQTPPTTIKKKPILNKIQNIDKTTKNITNKPTISKKGNSKKQSKPLDKNKNVNKKKVLKYQQQSQNEQNSQEDQDQQQLNKPNNIIQNKAIKKMTIKRQQKVMVAPNVIKEVKKMGVSQRFDQQQMDDKLMDGLCEDKKIKGRPKKSIYKTSINQIQFEHPEIKFNIQLINSNEQKNINKPIKQLKAPLSQQIAQLPLKPPQACEFKSGMGMRADETIILKNQGGLEMGGRNNRRAKLFPFRNYNQRDDQIDSQPSLDPFRLNKKKKKIYKSGNKIKDKNHKPYSLNRIFRKQIKINFPAFNVNINLNEISLSTFIKDFGVFDLIHCSLPVSYLHNFSQIVHLMQKGFIFVWVQKKQMQIGYHLLNRWGFDIVDQIIWIKADQDNNKIQADNIDFAHLITDDKFQETQNQTPLFINSKSTCLVGYKCPLGNKAQYRTKVSNNIIFGKSMDGVLKPPQIYEIADLMMPGAKKLQFGGQDQKGWLNLKHHEYSLYRCNVCIAQKDLYLLTNNPQKPVQCKKCIINCLKHQSDELKAVQNIYKSLPKIKIEQIVIIDQCIGKCHICNIKNDELKFKGYIKVQNSLFCLDCFNKSNLKQSKQIKIGVEKKKYYHKAMIICSQCQKSTICDSYFQCSKCKNHILCRECFWKDGLNKHQNIDEQALVNKKQVIHEWRFKFVKTTPLMKFACFGCKIDLNVPFWCCQTCQNWFWCGKCDRGNNDIHPHYQTDKHNEYIMI